MDIFSEEPGCRGGVEKKQEGNPKTVRWTVLGLSQHAGRAITRYIRDASGNVMAVYQNNVLTERPIYGSSRLGQLDSASAPGYRKVGLKRYELSNHLGNVLAVVSDRIRMRTDSTWTQVLSRTDYYPFGLEMTGRTESATYRYGFNGKEKDPSGQWSNQTHYDYGFRIYNPTIGKFLSVDPLTGSYPMLTPYQFASNRPIDGIDLDGLEYLSSEEARVEYKFGRLQVKVENFHRVNYGGWKIANSNPKNWSANSIGIDPTIASFKILAPNNSLTGDDIPEGNMPSTLKDQFTNGLNSVPGDRYTRRLAERGKFKSFVQSPQTTGSKGLGKFSSALDFVNFGANQYLNWAYFDDYSKIKEHTNFAIRANEDLLKALNNGGIIPEKYLNNKDLSNIMNVILQGESNSDNPDIYNIGMKIFNTISSPYEIIERQNHPSSDATKFNRLYRVPKN